MSYGDWAEWHERKHLERGGKSVTYVVCFAHQNRTCRCIALEEHHRWGRLHGEQKGNFTIAQAGAREARA